jgi:hypothetical protein
MVRAVPIIIKPPITYDPERETEELIENLCYRIRKLGRTTYGIKKLLSVENAINLAEGYKKRS